jgi:predicted alpha/beta-fold hydrolase
MPIVHSDFKPSALFRNAHFSTIYPAVFRNIPSKYERIRFETPDSDFFDVDTRTSDENKKLVLLLHGLEGSSQSNYIKSFGSYFFQKNYDVYAVNFRSCSGEPNRLLTSYHSGFTNDLHQLHNMLRLQKKYQSVHVIGFSLGGNAMLKFLSEINFSSQPIIQSAAAVSVPLHLQSSAEKLSIPSNYLYMRRFLKSLSEKIKTKAALFPQKVSLKDLHLIKNFREFDDHYTAPIHGFENALQYWNSCSSLFVLHKIKTPTLLINSKNDPFLTDACFPEDILNSNTFIHGIHTQYGGHVSFMRHLSGYDYWLENKVHQFFLSHT